MKKYITEDNPDVLKERLAKALQEAVNGQCDGAHHKAFSIDQTVKLLLGCEHVVYEAHLVHGQSYRREGLAPNLEYLQFIEDFEDADPETGEKWGEWDYGIE